MDTIRPALPGDLPLLRDIERAAGAPFREIGMAAVADDEPPTVAELAGYQEDGRAWVYEAADRPVAYLLVAPVDGYAHVEQVSVHPDHARRGIGRRLIGAAEQWAIKRDLPALSLTTYADVPWNGPYYRRLGFTVIPEDRLTPGLRAIRAHEREKGLDAWPRVTMSRPVFGRDGKGLSEN